MTAADWRLSNRWWIAEPERQTNRFMCGLPVTTAGLLIRQVNRRCARGTQVKLLIGGHFYADKSPVPALYMACVYQLLQWTTGLVARDAPDRFQYWLALLSSGVVYVVAVSCVDRLARGLETAMRLLVTFSFAFATIALPNARQVNNHILLLEVMCALLPILIPQTRAQLVAAGLLIGAISSS